MESAGIPSVALSDISIKLHCNNKNLHTDVGSFIRAENKAAQKTKQYMF